MGPSQISRCANCGATVSAPRGQDRFTCTYCGAANERAAPPADRFAGAPHVGASSRSPFAFVAIALVLVLAVVVVAGVYFLRRSPAQVPVADLPSSAPGAASVAPPSAAAPAGPYAGLPRGPDGFQWVDQYAAPVGVDANGDGVEDLAAPFVLESQGKLEVWVGVLDGKDFHLLWKRGPFGIREKATRKTGVAVGKGRLVAVEVTGLAHLYDLRTGDELAVFPYTPSDARGLCAIPGDEGGVYIGDPGGSGQRIDLATAKAARAASPKGCDYRQPRRPRDSGDPTQDLAAVVLAANAPEGFAWAGAPIGDGADAVGVATPKGDEGLVVVGVDAKKGGVRWQESATTLFGRAVDHVGVVTVGGGVAYVQTASELMALDAQSGHVRWRNAVATAGGRVTLTATRLYAAGLGWAGMPVNVFDVATGKLVARLGHGTGD